jgi:hypothetical protein
MRVFSTVTFAFVALTLSNLTFPSSSIAAATSEVEWSAEKTKTYFSELNDLNPGQGWNRAFAHFQKTHGPGPYPLAEIKEFHMSKPQPELSEGFQGLKILIRGNYDDVLSSEDPTVAGKNSKADLTGALFSFTRNYLSNSNSWGAVGALIAPLTWTYPTETRVMGPIELESAGLIPSISVDRVTNSKDSSKDVDSLLFRVGAFAKTTGGGSYFQTFRLFGRYGTDFDFRSEVPAAEFEYEPSFDIGKYISFDSLHRIYPLNFDDPEVKPPHQIVYRLRAYFHAEYGRIQNSGNAVLTTNEDFCRGGPVLELGLAPLLWDSLSCKVSYEYLDNFAGHIRNHHLFKIEPEWDLTGVAALKALGSPSVSLKASFQDGAIGVTDAPVRTLFIGLGVTL